MFAVGTIPVFVFPVVPALVSPLRATPTTFLLAPFMLNVYLGFGAPAASTDAGFAAYAAPPITIAAAKTPLKNFLYIFIPPFIKRIYFFIDL